MKTQPLQPKSNEDWFNPNTTQQPDLKTSSFRVQPRLEDIEMDDGSEEFVDASSLADCI